MTKISLLNLIFGFFVISVAAMAGSFLALDTARAFIYDKSILESWSIIIQQSAHGHTNMFGMLHIMLGLTLPYSLLSLKTKAIQSFGLGLGTVAMSFLMMLRSEYKPEVGSFDVLGFIIGAFLSVALLALLLHVYGLLLKLMRAKDY